MCRRTGRASSLLPMKLHITSRATRLGQALGPTPLHSKTEITPKPPSAQHSCPASLGFAIGGVAPLGHLTPPLTVIDEGLMAFDTIWAAAGTPNAVFATTPQALVAMTGGLVAAIAAR